MGNGSEERDTKNEEQQRGPDRLHRHERLRENRRALAHSFPPRAAEAAITENQAGGVHRTSRQAAVLVHPMAFYSTATETLYGSAKGKPIAVERSPCSIVVWWEAH